MSAYHPSCMAELRIRLDSGEKRVPNEVQGKKERGATAPQIPLSTEERGVALQDLDDQLEALARLRDELTPEEFQARRTAITEQRQRIEAPELGGPLATTGTDAEDLVVLGLITPLKARISRNGIRMADTFEIRLPYKDVPIDSRAVRSCMVTLFMGEVPPEGYAMGVKGERSAEGHLLSQIRPATAALTFQGFVDEWSTEFSEDGDAVVVSGRDLTALLIDQPLPDGEGIDLKKPIDVGVAELLDTFEQTRGMRVKLGSPQNPEGEGPGPVPADGVPACRKPRRGTIAKNVRATSDKMTVWDHITDVTVGLGLVPFMDRETLYLIEPRNFFVGRDKAKRVVYGRNVISLETGRSFGSVRVPTLEVRSYDCESGLTRWARAPQIGNGPFAGVFPARPPPAGDRPNEVQPSGTTTEKIRTIVLKGITSDKQLLAAAESLYQQIGRQEVEGAFETHDITSPGGAPGDFLTLNAGDSVELLVARPTADVQGGSTVQDIGAMTEARRAGYLRSIGWSERFAQKVSEVLEKLQFQTIFRVANVNVTWSSDDGFAIEANFINYLEIREDGEAVPEKPAGDRTEALLKDRTDPLAVALRSYSAKQATATALLERGTVTPDDYAASAAETEEEQRRALLEERR